MGLLEKTIWYDADDIRFISEHCQSNALPTLLAYLLTNQKTFIGRVNIDAGFRYSFQLFSIEKLCFPADTNTDTFSFRPGLFLERGGRISHILSGIKRLGYIIPSSFAINAGEIQARGEHNLHAFSFPDTHHDRLPTPLRVDLHLEMNTAAVMA